MLIMSAANNDMQMDFLIPSLWKKHINKMGDTYPEYKKNMQAYFTFLHEGRFAGHENAWVHIYNKRIIKFYNPDKTVFTTNAPYKSIYMPTRI